MHLTEKTERYLVYRDQVFYRELMHFNHNEILFLHHIFRDIRLNLNTERKLFPFVLTPLISLGKRANIVFKQNCHH